MIQSRNTSNFYYQVIHPLDVPPDQAPGGR
jgi:hypothetical protein